MFQNNEEFITRQCWAKHYLQSHLLAVSKCKITTVINLPGSSGLWEGPDNLGLSDTWTLSRLLMEG